VNRKVSAAMARLCALQRESSRPCQKTGAHTYPPPTARAAGG
jgi:hypothetical protein